MSPRGRSDILFLIACDLQSRQAEAVAKHEGLRKRSAHARVEAHLAQMLAFDFEPGVKQWRRACVAQGWYGTREQCAALGHVDSPLSPIERDPGLAIAAVWALDETGRSDPLRRRRSDIVGARYERQTGAA